MQYPDEGKENMDYDLIRDKFAGTDIGGERQCDATCTYKLVGKKVSDLTDTERRLFDADDNLDLCSHCGEICVEDDTATDDDTGALLGVCVPCMTGEL